MEFKYKLIISKDGIETTKEYKKLTDIADEYDIPIHIIRKIVLLSEGRQSNHRAHHRNRDVFESMKITEIKRSIKNI